MSATARYSCWAVSPIVAKWSESETRFIAHSAPRVVLHMHCCSISRPWGSMEHRGFWASTAGIEKFSPTSPACRPYRPTPTGRSPTRLSPAWRNSYVAYHDAVANFDPTPYSWPPSPPEPMAGEPRQPQRSEPRQHHLSGRTSGSAHRLRPRQPGFPALGCCVCGPPLGPAAARHVHHGRQARAQFPPTPPLRRQLRSRPGRTLAHPRRRRTESTMVLPACGAAHRRRP